MCPFRSRVRMEPSAYFAGALLLLLLPAKWFAAFLFAAVFHEMGHIAAIYLLGSRILEGKIGPAGAQILAAPQPEWKNLLCTLAGPAASFLLLLLVHVLPRVAICGFVQGVYNLLPFPAMDGGRILKSLHSQRPCNVGKQTI